MSNQGADRSRADRRRTLWRRVCSVAVTLGLLAGLGATSVRPLEQVEAEWTDTERATAAVQASVLAAPTIKACEVSTLLNLGIVFTEVTIRWESQYPASGNVLMISGVTMPSEHISVTGSGPYQYEFVGSASLLQALLGGLLGSKNAVIVQAKAGTAWTSEADTRTLAVGGLLGLLGANECTAP